MKAELGIRIRGQAELRTCESLTSCMKQRDIAEMRKDQGRRDKWGEIGNNMDSISLVYQIMYFCYHLIGSTRVA